MSSNDRSMAPLEDLPRGGRFDGKSDPAITEIRPLDQPGRT